MYENQIAADIIARMDRDIAAGGSGIGFAQPAPTWRPADYREAAVQSVLAGIGIRRREPLHPLAMELVQGGKTGILDALQVLAAARGAPTWGMPAPDVVRAALVSGDLPDLLGETARGVARAYQSPALADLLAISAPLTAKNYNADSYSQIDLGDLPLPSSWQREYVDCKILATGETFQVQSLFARLVISIQAITNDDRGLVAAGVRAFLTAAARNEARVAYGILATGTLLDGQPLFAAGFANEIVAPMTATGLGLGFAALRSQPTASGFPLDAPCAIVVTHADDEASMLALVQNLPIGRQPRVVGTAHLPDASAWYALADPAVAPVLGRTTMGGDPSGVSFDASVPLEETPALGIPATHSVGWAALGRIGAIRCTKT